MKRSDWMPILLITGGFLVASIALGFVGGAFKRKKIETDETAEEA